MKALDVSFLIVGTPRSGTTLIQRLACELPRVSVSPETHFFSSGFARALALRGGFPLLGTRLREEVAAYTRTFEDWTGHPLPLDGERVAALLGDSCEAPVDLFTAIVRTLATPEPLVGEKTPAHLRWWRPLSRAIPSLKLLIVVRDPRAVVESNLRMPWGGRSHITVAERWRADQRSALAASRELGEERCLLVRYEGVVHDPRGFIEELAAFLGTDTPAPMPDGMRDVGRSFVLPWETWKERALEPVTSGLIDAWIETLSPGKSLDIAAICHREMKELGYPAPTGRPSAECRRAVLEARSLGRGYRIRRSKERRQRRLDALEL